MTGLPQRDRPAPAKSRVPIRKSSLKTTSLMNDATRAAVTHADASTPSVAIFTSVPRHVIVLQSNCVRIFFLILFTMRLLSNYLSRIFPPCVALASPASPWNSGMWFKPSDEIPRKLKRRLKRRSICDVTKGHIQRQWQYPNPNRRQCQFCPLRNKSYVLPRSYNKM